MTQTDAPSVELTEEVQALLAQDIHNTLQNAKFEQTDAEHQGHLFRFGDDLQALVSFEELGEQATFEENEEVLLLIEQEISGLWHASLKKAQKLKLWEHYDELAQTGAIVDGVIVGQNSGGVSVDAGIRAFVPMSQLDVHRVEDASAYLGRKEKFQVLEFKQDKGELVLSRRKVLESVQNESREEILETLEPGATFDGVVRGVKPYGAFVDIGGGVQGLLHVSNMTWGRLDNANELFSPGDEVRVIVLEYDPEKKRIGLGRKQLLDDPWTGTAEYKVGDVMAGTIVSLADFGAFVELAPGLEGLVHVSEISWTQRVNKPQDVLKAGQEIAVRIIDINPEERRLSLSIKQLEENPWSLFAQNISEGQRLNGTVVSLTEFGVFVEVQPDIQGLVHVSNVSWTERTNNLSELFTIGQSIEVMVLDIEPEVQRLALGIKQLEENPWEAIARIAKPGAKIKGTVSRTTQFGAFVTLADGIEGLIHVSELSEDRVDDVQQVVRPGQEVEPLVLSFDAEAQRISLSLKREALDDETLHEYDDATDATSTLGDILRAKLGVEEQAEEE